MKHLLVGIGVLVALMLVGILGMGAWGNPQALPKTNAIEGLWLIRYGVYAAVVGFWVFIAPRVTVPAWKDGQEQDREAVKAKRGQIRQMTWKVCAFLVFFEVVVVHKFWIA